MNNIFVIGNGESRKDVDLNEIKSRGKVYGCNALYRDFSPDILVCVDNKIIFEVVDSGYCKENLCLFADWNEFPAEMYESFHMGAMTIPVNSGEKGERFSIFGAGVGYETMYVVWLNDEKITPFSNNVCLEAGPSAIKIASEENSDNVYLLGFDIYSKDGKMNNIYKNTKCYSSTDSTSISPNKWIFDMKRIFQNNLDVSYIRVSDIDNNPPEWSSLTNVKIIDYDTFWKNTESKKEVYK